MAEGLSGRGLDLAARTPAQRPRFDSRPLGERLTSSVVPVVFGLDLVLRLYLAITHPSKMLGDASVYYRATEAWIHGGDPWLAHTDFDMTFAAPPPALLLNLPLIPFGETAAMVFWPIAGLAGAILALRHYALPWWWLAFPPFVEAMTAGSPDLALLGALVLGGGALTAIAKPYAIPAMLGEARWRALLAAVAVGIGTAPILPWARFISDWPQISQALTTQSIGIQLSPVMELVVLVALVSLGRLGVLMATPALWPKAQMHYAMFSLEAARSSRILTLAMSFPATAFIGVLVVATISQVKRFVPGKPPGFDNGAAASPSILELASTSPEPPPRG